MVDKKMNELQVYEEELRDAFKISGINKIIDK
jgi:hypothetical protein